MKKDILFLCQFFYPEYNSSAMLPFDTAKYLATHWFTVGALCGYPKEYNSSGKALLNENVNNIEIQRVKYIELSRVKKINRLINYFSFTLVILLKIGQLKNYRSVIVYSNPPVLPIVPILAKKFYGTKFVFVAYDVYPEIAYASGVLKSGDLIDLLMRKINKSLYKNASYVIALTDEMKEFLIKRRSELSKDRVITIANWAREIRIQPDKSTYKNFGYSEGQFIVSYFGNMGTCQDMETMLGAATVLKDNNKICFLIAGHGNKKKYVDEQIKNLDLKNVKLLDFLTGDDFEQAISISNCCIVSLEKGLKGTCAPSKYYSYLQGGRPVLAVVENDSYLAREIEHEQIGYVIEIGDSKALAEKVIEMMENPQECRKMEDRARRVYENNYSYKISMNKYKYVFTEILK